MHYGSPAARTAGLAATPDGDSADHPSEVPEPALRPADTSSVRRWWGPAALALFAVVAAAWLLHLTQGLVFYYDEWDFVTQRRGGLAAAWRPHNQHVVVLPVLVYKAIFGVFGLGNYLPFRVLITGVHLLCATGVFLLARRRAGDAIALPLASVLLFFGPAWEDVLWPFQIGFLIPIAAGLKLMLVLERRDMRGDLVACGLLVVGVASGSLGVVIGVGLGVELRSARARPANRPRPGRSGAAVCGVVPPTSR